MNNDTVLKVGWRFPKISWTVVLLVVVAGVLVARQYVIDDMNRIDRSMDGKVFVKPLGPGRSEGRITYEGGSVAYEIYVAPLAEQASYEKLSIRHEEDDFWNFLPGSNHPNTEVYLIHWTWGMWKQQCFTSPEGVVCPDKGEPVRTIPDEYNKYIDQARDALRKAGQKPPIDMPLLTVSSSSTSRHGAGYYCLFVSINIVYPSN